MRAIILAGGKGTRLRPFTTCIPKPLVPLGNELPILEVIIRQLAGSGFDHITITVNHLAHLIRAFFGNGDKWGIRIDYSMEETPLSTIGPITLIDDLPERFLVMNGDILCNLDYRKFYLDHVSQDVPVSVATYKRTSLIDFGVLDLDEEDRIISFSEKPRLELTVSMGIYCIDRSVIERLPRGQRYGFDDLMVDGILNGAGYRAVRFDGLWLDIGRPEDYDYCNENFPELRRQMGL